MKQQKTGIFWFTNDLRLHDNPSLMRANTLVDELVCIYIIDFDWRGSNQYSQKSKNYHSSIFLRESLSDLDRNLKRLGQNLVVIQANTVSVINSLITQVNASDVFRSDNAGFYENNKWDLLNKENSNVNFHSTDSHTLFDLEKLPFSLSELPASFTKFKNAVSDIEYSKPITELQYLPKPIEIQHPRIMVLDQKETPKKFKGGESHALKHLNLYFDSEKPASYKQVRNALDGWDNSCKLSPWLANGGLSVRQVFTLNYYGENTFNGMHIKIAQNYLHSQALNV